MCNSHLSEELKYFISSIKRNFKVFACPRIMFFIFSCSINFHVLKEIQMSILLTMFNLINNAFMWNKNDLIMVWRIAIQEITTATLSQRLITIFMFLCYVDLYISNFKLKSFPYLNCSCISLVCTFYFLHLLGYINVFNLERKKPALIFRLSSERLSKVFDNS